MKIFRKKKRAPEGAAFMTNYLSSSFPTRAVNFFPSATGSPSAIEASP